MFHTISGFDRIGEENAFAVLARATELADSGRDIINLGIGQPDFRTPDHIVEAAVKAVGLALRQAMKKGADVFSTKGSVELERHGD